MNAFQGTWNDQDGNTITVEESANIVTKLTYSNGRGPFQGYELDLGSPVVTVNFTDGQVPAAGLQSGVIQFDNKTLNWSNGTTWTKQ